MLSGASPDIDLGTVEKHRRTACRGAGSGFESGLGALHIACIVLRKVGLRLGYQICKHHDGTVHALNNPRLCRVIMPDRLRAPWSRF